VADIYVINPDTPEDSAQVRARTGITVPILLDPNYTGAATYHLAGEGRPMSGLVGWVVVDAGGIVREQRVDVEFGRHTAQMIEVVRRLR
jgi:peroxiredoxin